MRTPDPASRIPNPPEEPEPDGTPEWLAQRARAFPDRLALVAGSRRWSFGELETAASRTAERLAASGVAVGTRVAVLVRDGALFVGTTHALTKLGAIMIPLHTRLATVELARLLEDSHATALICDQALATRGEAARAALPMVRQLGAEDPGPERHRHPREAGRPTGVGSARDQRSLSSIQCMVYTSATSGKPKGVLLTYGNHWWSAIGSALNLGLHRDDCWLACLPLCHIGGFAILWRSVIYGIPMMVHDTFDPDAVNHDIDGGHVTLLSIVGTMLQRLLDARGPRPFPPTLRTILLGGGPAPRALLETCVGRGVPIAPTYGLTETASQVATLSPDEVPSKIGSAGKAVFPTELRIAVSSGRQALAGQVGEILVRGPVVMRGYDGRPDETAQALRSGWLHTSDLGYLDSDGYLYVVDRRTDLIISGGENVYPSEVELVLQSHPAVEDACVIGVPDAAWGQAVIAAVKVRACAQTSADQIRAFCAERLAAYKVPKQLWFVEELPRSAGGKLLRRCLRERATELFRPEHTGAADEDARGFPNA